MDESGVARAYLLVTETQFFSSRRAISFDDDVGFARKLQKNCPPIRLFNIEGYARFIGVEVKEVKTLFRVWRVVFERRLAPRLIAGGRLDLDHVGAHVRQEF